MSNKTVTIEESLDYLSHSIAEGLNTFTSTNTIQKCIDNLSGDIYTSVDNNTEAINKLTNEVASLKNELGGYLDELSGLRDLDSIKYSLELIANTLYKHYENK